MRFTTSKGSIQRLIRNLQDLGYTVVGPSISEGVVRLRELKGASDLARGVVDAQAPGSYALGGEGQLLFSFVNGPDSPKGYLHPADVELSRLIDSGSGIESMSCFRPGGRYAFFGIRPCDLRAVQIMDRTMLVPSFEDGVYSYLRSGAIFIVVNCTRAGENCFCASMGTGPGAESGYDIAITELPETLLFDVPEVNKAMFRG